jgi:hypothetical protein
MINASMNLRSIFFNDDYRSTTNENWIKTFSFFFFSYRIKIQVEIISVQHETSWYEMSKMIFVIKIIHINQVIKIFKKKKKEKRRSIKARETSLFFLWRIFRRKSINTFIHSTRVAFLFISFFLEWIVEKNSQSNCQNDDSETIKKKKDIFSET